MRTPKLLIIGWDGATWDLLTPWVHRGELPNLERLMQSGCWGKLASTPLPLSPAAWSTIVTGQNPGRHGVFDWFERKPDGYGLEYVRTGRIKAKTIWQYFTEGGRSLGVFCLPMVYPATPLNGFMISGMAAPNANAQGFSYPPGLLTELEDKLGKYLATEAAIYRYGCEEEFLRSILQWLEYQKKVIFYLLEHYPCDAYLLVMMQSDHIQHKFWRYLESDFPGFDPDRDSCYQGGILQVYQALDSMLGELLDLFGDQSNFMLLSDHGAGPTYGIMYLNRWLQQVGLLHLRQGPSTWFKSWAARRNLAIQFFRLLARAGLGELAQLVSKPTRNKALNGYLSFDDVDWVTTNAYARGAFGQIFVNLKGREPQGSVSPGEDYERVVETILNKLRDLQHLETGRPLITDLHRREEVLEGTFLEQAADILFSIQNYEYQSSIKLGFDGEDLLGQSEYEDSGGHRPEGILVMAGPGIKSGHEIVGASVTDILPTALAMVDLPIPVNLDGNPLMQGMMPNLLVTLRYEESRDWQDRPGTALPDLGPEEVHKIEERLRKLGYLG